MYISSYLYDCQYIQEQVPKITAKERFKFITLGFVTGSYATMHHALRAIDESIFAVIRLELKPLHFTLVHLIASIVQGICIPILGFTQAFNCFRSLKSDLQDFESGLFDDYFLRENEHDLNMNYSAITPPITQQCGYLNGPILTISRGIIATINEFAQTIFFCSRKVIDSSLTERQIQTAPTTSYHAMIGCFSASIFGVFFLTVRETLWLYTKEKPL